MITSVASPDDATSSTTRRRQESPAVSDVLFNSPPPPAPAGLQTAIGLVGWLDDLLDMARNRGDASAARLIAGVMDDLRAANGD